jgi:aspartate/methionine/tyrosine aminotransferase
VRFSGRTPGDLQPNRLAAAVAAARASGRPLIDLIETNPTAVDLDHSWAAIGEALAEAGAGRYRPDPRGLPAARAAVAAWYARRGVAVDAEQVVLTASTSEAYGFLFKLLCDPGEAVLVPRPSYPLFDHLAAAEAVATIPYRRGAVEAVLTAAARALIVVSPNNPTGAVLPAGELAELAALCAERGLALIGDEVFADSADGGAPSVAAVDGALAFALGGLSKTAGLPQLKLGWIAVAGPPALRDQALARLELIADTYLSVATPVQLALPRLLELAVPFQHAVRARIADNRARIAAALAGLPGARLAPAAGGWSAIIDLPGGTDEESLATSLAADDGVLVHPGWLFDLPGPSVVVSTIVPPAVTSAGLRAIVVRCGG